MDEAVYFHLNKEMEFQILDTLFLTRNCCYISPKIKTGGIADGIPVRMLIEINTIRGNSDFSYQSLINGGRGEYTWESLAKMSLHLLIWPLWYSTGLDFVQ